MARELRGWTRPRPIRIAFLIGEGEHSSLILDAIFADCYSRWGGRFSLIVPCRKDRIVPSYWPWLEKYGPDIVYSYVGLSESDILEVHERLAPSEYKFHRLTSEPRLDVFGFKPSYGFSPLSSLAAVFRLARYSTADHIGAPVKIIDRWYGETPSQLLADNFGTYHNSVGSSVFPYDAQVAASLITIVTPEHQQDRQLGIPPDLITFATEALAYEEFAARRATSLSVISAQFTPRLEFHDQRWHGSLNVVLGETFYDRIVFWNSRLLTPVWLDGDVGVVRVTSEALRDDEFLRAIGNLLRHRNHYGGGHSNITIRSTSASPEALEEARQLILSTRPWGNVGTELLDGVDSIVPTMSALEQSSEQNHGGRTLFSRPTWTQFNWTPPNARPPAKIPDHLTDVPSQQSFAEGYWCADFTLEYPGPEIRFGSNLWTLPKRWRMNQAFAHSLVGSSGPTGWSPPGWRGRAGCYSIYVSLSRPVAEIEPPTAMAAMQWALVSDGMRPPQLGEVYPRRKVDRLQPSNEARYLSGILGMTGGLDRAKKLFLHPFLVGVFASLGGSTSLPMDKVMPTANRLQKRAQFEQTFDLRNEREREVLANLIVKASGSLKKPLDYLAYDYLSRAWRMHRETYWRENPQVGVPDDPEEWDQLEQRTLDECLIEMRQRQIMFQGHQWTCQFCHHKNWLDMSELAPQLACKICQRIEPAPIEIKWLFRPNEFVIQALRDHSVLSLVWALTALQARARESFIFLEPAWLYYHESSTSPDAEADLLVIIDGNSFLCEVKASWSVLRTRDITNLVELAKRLRPDIALLAVMENDRKLDEEIESAGAALAAVGIRFELMTLEQYSLEDGPYLLS
ncbi:hypothetical protein JQ596_16145 [Bradyrhizobium manausense]|uniref:hypothetical protein n=1 Tax=Bradyrhizobium manausense TaxID=989370 RepID=UPI001BACE4FB|nr:hypothetical protein [Bradyrhizobium manausense]MBR0827072.1 hypothetical protein [Bradyrhizobium manausense]